MSHRNRACKAALRLSVNGLAGIRRYLSLAPTGTDACDNDKSELRPRKRATRTRNLHTTPHGHVKARRLFLDVARNPSRSLLIMTPSPAREGSANAGSSSGNLEEKPRLSEHEKKANHIASGNQPYHCPSIRLLALMPLCLWKC